jgi:TetR/AcrR family transcriptional regulator, repressor for uid operon
MARTKNLELHDQRRAEILLAAARVFKAKGFHLARTEDICQDAGMSAGTVFRHFATKQAMIAAIAQAEFDSYKADLERIASKTGLEWLSRLDKQGLEELLTPTAYDLGADSWLELIRDPEGRAQVLAFDRHLRTILTRELARGQKAGWVRPELDAKGAANLLLAIVSGLYFDEQIGAEIDRTATARALSDLVGHFILSGK